MFEFNKEKLSVKIDKDMDILKLDDPRCYILTSSNETGELCLRISKNFDYDSLPIRRDEVMAKWAKVSNKYVYEVFLDLDGKRSLDRGVRESVFRSELPLALRALVVGDEEFIIKNELQDSSIVVYFNSDNDDFNKVEEWGNIRDYLIDESRENDDEYRQQGERDRVILTLLSPFIERELNKLFGRRHFFCPNYSRILSINPMTPPFACRGSFSVTVGIRVGFNPPKFNQQGFNQMVANEWAFNQTGLNIPGFNNVIIEFRVRPDGVRTQSVRNPR